MKLCLYNCLLQAQLLPLEDVVVGVEDAGDVLSQVAVQHSLQHPTASAVTTTATNRSILAYLRLQLVQKPVTAQDPAS